MKKDYLFTFTLPANKLWFSPPASPRVYKGERITITAEGKARTHPELEFHGPGGGTDIPHKHNFILPEVQRGKLLAAIVNEEDGMGRIFEVGDEATIIPYQSGYLVFALNDSTACHGWIYGSHDYEDNEGDFTITVIFNDRMAKETEKEIAL